MVIFPPRISTFFLGGGAYKALHSKLYYGPMGTSLILQKNGWRQSWRQLYWFEKKFTKDFENYVSKYKKVSQILSQNGKTTRKFLNDSFILTEDTFSVKDNSFVSGNLFPPTLSIVSVIFLLENLHEF